MKLILFDGHEYGCLGFVGRTIIPGIRRELFGRDLDQGYLFGLKNRPAINGGEPAQNLRHQTIPIVRIRHDDRALPLVDKGEQHADEAFVAPAMAEGSSLLRRRGAQPDSQAPVPGPRSQHLPGHFWRDDFMGFPGRGLLQLDGQAAQIRRRRPQSRRGQFGIDMPLSFDGFAVHLKARSGLIHFVRRERLRKRAVIHAQGVQHRCFHIIRKRPARHIRHEELGHQEPPSGVPPLRSGNHVDTNRRRIGWFFPVEHLNNCGDRVGSGVSGKARNRQPGAVRQETAQGDFLFFRKFVLRNLPGDQLVVDRRIEIQNSLFDKAKHTQSGHGLADGRGLKEGLGSDGILAAGFLDAIPFGPFDLPFIDDRDTHSRNAVVLHPVQNVHGGRRLALFVQSRLQGILRGPDPGRVRGRFFRRGSAFTASGDKQHNRDR